MITKKNTLIGTILTFTIVILLVFFLYNSNKPVLAKQNEENSSNEVTSAMIMDIFTPEIIKAIKQNYKIDKNDAIGYGIEQFKIIEDKESIFTRYYVLIDVETYTDTGNKLKIIGKDTIKFSMKNGKQIKFINFYHDKWK